MLQTYTQNRRLILHAMPKSAV